MKAELISIGDEILIGQVVNTNSAWLGEKLTGIGIEVTRNIVIADSREEILQTLRESGNRAELVIITGGIGPTRDDVTKSTLAEYFGSRMGHNEEAMERIRNLLKGRVDLNELNVGQAMLPDNCRPIPNFNGTASGMWFEKEGTQYISLPGVPYEMKTMMSDYILPALRETYDLPAIVHRTVLVQGIPESHLAIMLREFEETLPAGMRLAYLPSPGRVRLRLGSSGKDRKTVEKIVDRQIERMKTFIPQEQVYGKDWEELEVLVGRLLKEKNASLALAESCTGGSIAQMITSVPGSSAYFLGSVVAYSNRIKVEVLGVNPSSIDKHGAVSREVVEQMAEGVRKRFGSDYSIATSGIAGPDGGTPEKPVGTTWIAVASSHSTESALHQLGDHRGRNIQKAALTGLNMLRNVIINSK
jgi:nicotinamide-nucleotide amidase